jgi:hypothetical protein
VQAAYVAGGGGVYAVSSILPYSGPVNSSHMAYASALVLTGPLSTTPQTYSRTLSPISPTLGLPDFATSSAPTYVLTNGAIVGGDLSPSFVERVQLAGTSVVSELMASDHLTRLFAARLLSFVAQPLAGAFSAAPAEVRTWRAVAPMLSNPALHKPNAEFAPGSMFFIRKTVREGDVVFVSNCAPVTVIGAPPTACAGATTLESAFPLPYSGVLTQPFSAGTIQTLQGLRAWISTVPVSALNNEMSVVAFELNGSVYQGFLARDGDPIRAALIDGTSVDYTVLFNKTAFDSLKAGVTF